MKHERLTTVGSRTAARTVENRTWLCVDSDSDVVTREGSEHRSSYLYPKLKDMNVDLVTCSGIDATRQNVFSHARVRTVVYLTGEGHGSDKQFLGQDDDVVFEAGNYPPEEVAGKIVHLLSCKAGIDLGPDMVRKGCRAFFGYDDDFAYHADFTELSLRCDSEIDLAFAEGLSAAQVYSRVKDYFIKTVAALRAMGGYPATWAASALDRNLRHLVCPSSSGTSWGDEAARVE